MTSGRRPSLGSRLGLALLPAAARGFAGVLQSTLKIEVRGLEPARALMAARKPVLYAALHGEAAALLLLRRRAQFPMMALMVSRSRDGDAASAVLAALGARIARGSSSRGGAAGLLALKSMLSGERGGPEPPPVGVHLVDGPRGPRGEVKPGLIAAARLTGAAIVPVRAFASRAWIARRAWDRHMLPLPFARVVYWFGEPMEIAAEAGPGDDEVLAKEAGRRLAELGT